MNIRFLIALISFTMIIFPSIVLSKPNKVIVLVDGLNIRTGPGTNFSIIGKANKNDKFPIVSQQIDWVELQLETRTGWVSKDFLKVENEAFEENRINESITLQIDNIHIREGPSTHSNIIYFTEKGDTFQIVSETGTWYKVQNDKITGYMFKDFLDKQIKSSFSLREKTILIDPGHGGRDVGAIGISGIYEKNLTLRTSKKLQKQLSLLGATPIMTRDSDQFISLHSRSSFANLTEADVYISIHYNSSPDKPRVSGIETFYYKNRDKELAASIQQELIKETNGNNRGISNGDLYVLRHTTKPAILIELGFISNPAMEENIKSSRYQEKIVTGIIRGLELYFNIMQENPGAT